MRSRLFLLVVLLALLTGCSEQDTTAGWYDGPSDGGGEGADVSVVDARDELDDAGVDAAPDGGAEAASDGAVPEAGPTGPAQYPSDRTHSPLTGHVVTHLQQVLAGNPGSRGDLFMKVGDSISASTHFMHCFAGGDAELGAHAGLQPTLDVYAGASIEGTTPFDRVSLAVESGRTAYWAMDGQPSPLEREIEALNPALAVVMFGTNDIGWFSPDHLHTLTWYHGHFFDLVDALLEAGIVPVLSTLPPRDDSPALDAWVPTFNAVIRAIAQGRQVPLVDFHRELMALGNHGLSGDGVHPNAYTGAGGACSMAPDGLVFGYNVRNWITLTALDRVRRATMAGEGALDEHAPGMAGTGTSTDPFLVNADPFVDLRDTSEATSNSFDVYACSGADESGPEYVYRLEVSEPVSLRAIVLDRGEVDVDLHLLGGEVSEASCFARGDTIVEQDLSPGTYHLVVDTYVSGGQALAGEFLLTVSTCSPGDSACKQ